MTLEAKDLARPDEKREFGHGEMELVELPGVTVGRAHMHPGWRWSNDVKPIVGTESCQQPHTMYVLSGKIHIVMDDGQEADVEAGQSAVVSPGHDAWVVGDEDFVAIDWTAAATYATAPE
ncbi:cupin domain-containing protein [Saccharopolyspora taberi]|uniref:Cupin domain-containing protein n=1 Tax=Saccharopolyspora taberi TaxID=60895 RepID=A0ABN3VL46_9PSEU